MQEREINLQEYKREFPLFSLCGLNCGLCPRYHTDGESKCPGCGGENFHLKHPACAVITCNRKHEQVEYCFQCSSYPCGKYSKASEVDSFISYRNVTSDFAKAKRDHDQYKRQLGEKVDMLQFLINNYNDGRRKNFYCNAVNLLDLETSQDIMTEIKEKISKQDISLKEKISQIILLFEERADKENIELKLRK